MSDPFVPDRRQDAPTWLLDFLKSQLDRNRDRAESARKDARDHLNAMRECEAEACCAEERVKILVAAISTIQEADLGNALEIEQAEAADAGRGE